MSGLFICNRFISELGLYHHKSISCWPATFFNRRLRNRYLFFPMTTNYYLGLHRFDKTECHRSAAGASCSMQHVFFYWNIMCTLLQMIWKSWGIPYFLETSSYLSSDHNTSCTGSIIFPFDQICPVLSGWGHLAAYVVYWLQWWWVAYLHDSDGILNNSR